MENDKTVLVIGATGNQGGGTARALLSRGWRVRALVRDTEAAAARELAAAGARLVRGDLDDAATLRPALADCHGVFSVQPLGIGEAELDAEVRRGSTVADLAEEAGVAHFVYSSVGGAERDTGIDHFASKARIERHILGTSLATTILRPTFFMNNLLGYADAVDERVMALPVVPDRPMQFIAAADIGRVAAEAFDNPHEFVGVQLEIAGDRLTFTEVAEIYQRTTAVPTRLDPQPIADRMFAWFADSGYQADLDALRARFPWLQRFDAFLRENVATASARR